MFGIRGNIDHISTCTLARPSSRAAGMQRNIGDDWRNVIFIGVITAMSAIMAQPGEQHGKANRHLSGECGLCADISAASAMVYFHRSFFVSVLTL